MKFLITCILLLAGSLSSFSQRSGTAINSSDALHNLKEKEIMGEFTIVLDSLIEDNYKKHLVQNSREKGVSGYRIRIFSDNGQGAKDNQKRMRARFLSLYPGVPTYYRYEGSYYKVYVGDFRTKRNAYKVLGQVQVNFPDAFIVEDNIVIEE